MKEIYDYLNLPEKFFFPNSPVTIGKKIKLKDMKAIGIEPVSQKKNTFQNKRMSLYRKSYTFNNNNINNENFGRSSISYNYFSNKEKQQQPNNDKYEIIDNEQLKKIFNKFKTFINNNNLTPRNNNNFMKIIEKNKNKNKNNNSKIKNKIERNKDLPLELTESLTFQNNKIKIRQNFDNKIKNISKHISNLINKNENDLLLNRVDDYNFKKELLKEIDFKKPPDDKYGIYKWNISLRRSKNFEGMRNTYINLTREQNPFWGIVVEKYPEIKELKLKPGILNKNKLFLEKFKKTYFPFINHKDFKNLENIDTLSVKGQNLFNIEYNREINNNNNNNKKKLHKTFVDKGGKVILKTDINNIFGESTFYENYNTNNLSTTNKTNLSNINNVYNTFTNKFYLKNNYNKSVVNFKNNPNFSFANDEIFKKSTFFKSKSSADI